MRNRPVASTSSHASPSTPVAKTRKKPGAALPAALRQRLQRATVKAGENAVAKRLKINSVTLMRAISGLSVMHATAHVIEHQIDEVEKLPAL